MNTSKASDRQFKLKHIVFALLFSGITIGASQADELLTLSVTQGQTATKSFNSLNDLLNTAKNTNSIQQSLLPNYAAGSPANLTIGYLGLNFSLSTLAYSNITNSQLLNFSIGNINTGTIPFTGHGTDAQTAQADAMKQLENYLKANSGNIYQQIQKYTVANSPNNVIAGNPNSIQTQAATADFEAGFSGQVTSLASGSTGSIPNLFGAGFTYGQFKQNGTDVTSLTIPLSYTWRFSDNPQQQVILSVPLTEGKIGNANSYAGKVGLAIKFPITDRWTLTPAVSYGIVASPELAQAAQQVSASLTSAYVFPLSDDGKAISVGNMIGQYQTLKLTVGGYTFDPGVSNTVYRNGLMYATPLGMSIFSRELSGEIALINTLFTGTQTYTKSQNELTLTVGTGKAHSGSDSFIRVGLSLIQAKEANGMRVNFGYWF